MEYNLEDGTPSFVIEVDFLKGEKGDTGFSPKIEVAKLTSAEYVLKIINKDGEFYTPNLKHDISMEDYVLQEEGKGLSSNSFEDEEKAKLQELYNYDDTELKDRITTIENNIEDIAKIYTGTNITANTVAGMGMIKKVYGNTIETGEGEKSPSNVYKIECVADDINLLKQSDIPNSTVEGIKYISLTQGVKVSGTSTARSVLTFTNIISRLQKGLTYTCIINQNSNFTFLFKINYSDGTDTAYAKEFTYTNNISSVIPYLQVETGKTINDILHVKVSIKKKEKYSPYQKGTLEIISKNGTNASSNLIYLSPLCKISDTIKDYIDYSNKKVYRKCMYLSLNGEENWELATTNTTGINRFMLKNTSIKKYNNTIVGNIKSNKLKAITAEQSYMGIEGISGVSTGGIYICIDACKNMTLAQFKAYLASNNIIAICELENTQVEDIDCSNKIIQYEENTNIYSSDNVEIEVSLTNNKGISQINEDLKNSEEILHKLSETEENSYRNATYRHLVQWIRIGNLINLRFSNWNSSGGQLANNDEYNIVLPFKAKLYIESNYIKINNNILTIKAQQANTWHNEILTFLVD